jgi:hypothetical protein
MKSALDSEFGQPKISNHRAAGKAADGSNNYEQHQSIERNKSFQIIRDHLVNKHMESCRRPDFNIAIIAPLDGLKDIEAATTRRPHQLKEAPIKHAKTRIKTNTSNKFANSTPVEYSTFNSVMDVSHLSVNTPNRLNLRNSLRQETVIIGKNEAASVVNEELKVLSHHKRDDVLIRSSNNNDRKELSFLNLKLAENSSKLAELYHMMPSLTPKIKQTRLTPNFYFNYRQSGCNINVSLYLLNEIKREKKFYCSNSFIEIFLKYF